MFAQTNPLKPVLLFDLDGTLADSALDLLDSLRVLLGQESRVIPPSVNIRNFVGQGARVLIQRGFQASHPAPAPPLTAEKEEELLQKFLTHYESHLADKTILFPEVEPTLVHLSQMGWTLTVCTNKIERLASELLRRLNVSHYFAAICGQDTFACAKPDPRILWSTLEQVQGDRDCAIMIGDSETDIEVARAAGIPVIATSFGYSAQPIPLLAPDRIISHFKELPEAVDSLRPKLTGESQ